MEILDEDQAQIEEIELFNMLQIAFEDNHLLKGEKECDYTIALY